MSTPIAPPRNAELFLRRDMNEVLRSAERSVYQSRHQRNLQLPALNFSDSLFELEGIYRTFLLDHPNNPRVRAIYLSTIGNLVYLQNQIDYTSNPLIPHARRLADPILRRNLTSGPHEVTPTTCHLMMWTTAQCRLAGRMEDVYRHSQGSPLSNNALIHISYVINLTEMLDLIPPEEIRDAEPHIHESLQFAVRKTHEIQQRNAQRELSTALLASLDRLQRTIHSKLPDSPKKEQLLDLVRQP